MLLKISVAIDLNQKKMNKFLNNLFKLGIQKVLIWLFIVSLFYVFLDSVIYTIEAVFKWEHKLNKLNLVNEFICFVIFIVGVYRYNTPSKYSNTPSKKNKRRKR